MLSRRPPLPRRPAATSNLVYDCSMLPDDETVFLLPNNSRFSYAHHHHHQYQPPPDQIQRPPRYSYLLEESVILNDSMRRGISGGSADQASSMYDDSVSRRISGGSAEAIAKYIEVRVVLRRQNQNDAVGGEDEDEDEDGLCVVCQDALREENGRMARLDCGHRYHVDCIKKWLHLRNTCPLCNTTLQFA